MNQPCAITSGVVVAQNTDGTYQVRLSGLPASADPYAHVPCAQHVTLQPGQRVTLGMLGDPPDRQRPVILNARSRMAWGRGRIPLGGWPNYLCSEYRQGGNPTATLPKTLNLDPSWTSGAGVLTPPVCTTNIMILSKSATHGAPQNGIEALDMTTQGRLWLIPCQAADGNFNPAIDGQDLYAWTNRQIVGSTNSGLKKWSLETGALAWDASRIVPYGLRTLCFDGQRNSLYAWQPPSTVKALDKSDGTLLWGVDLAALYPGFSQSQGNELIFAEGKLFIALYRVDADFNPMEARIFCLNPVDGSVLWNTRLNAEPLSDQVYCSLSSYWSYQNGKLLAHIYHYGPYGAEPPVPAYSQYIGVTAASGEVAFRTTMTGLWGILFASPSSPWFLAMNSMDHKMAGISNAGSVLWTLDNSGTAGPPGVVFCGDIAAVMRASPFAISTYSSAGRLTTWSAITGTWDDFYGDRQQLMAVGNHIYYRDNSLAIRRLGEPLAG